MSLNEDKIVDVDIATAVRVQRGNNRLYFSLRKLDIEFWGLEVKDLVVVSIKKLKKYDPFKEAKR